MTLDKRAIRLHLLHYAMECVQQETVLSLCRQYPVTMSRVCSESGALKIYISELHEKCSNEMGIFQYTADLFPHHSYRSPREKAPCTNRHVSSLAKGKESNCLLIFKNPTPCPIL